MVILVPYLLRILLGRLHPTLVAVAYYNIRATLTLTISLLTAKTLLMIAFIFRFEAMTGEALNLHVHNSTKKMAAKTAKQIYVFFLVLLSISKRGFFLY